MSSSTELARRAKVLRQRPEPAPRALLADLNVAVEHRTLTPAGVRQALDEGYRDGYRRGREDGLEAAAGEIFQAKQAVRERFERLAANVEGAVGELRASDRLQLVALEDELVEAAISIAEAILDRELALCASTGRDAVARALRLVDASRPAVVRLHPEDLAQLTDDELVVGQDVSFVADPGVDRGGCLVESGSSRVDARLGAALDRARAALKGSA
jgi:flagellar assembly protein FliH